MMTASQSSLAQWGRAFGVALMLHGSVTALAVMASSRSIDVAGSNEPAIAVELAPPTDELGESSVTAAPGTIADNVDPEPHDIAEPLRAETAQAEPSAPLLVAETAVTPPPRLIEKPRPKKPVKKPRSTPAKDNPTERDATTSSVPAAAPRSGRSGASLASWQSALAAHLDRHKRYPSAARANGATGTVLLVIAIDRGGNVIAASVGRSSGTAVLDSEGTALAQRASPVPAPPPEVSGNRITLSVPVRFDVR
jgi:protein TonB